MDAKDEGCMVIIEMDANAKIGKEVIQKDVHNQSNNERILIDMARRQNLTIVNSLDLCKGVITRERVFENKVEQSVIDYILICEELLRYLTVMKIDDERTYVLTNYQKKKTKKKTTSSDHNLLFSKFSLTSIQQPRILRKEFFQFKCENSKKLFLEETNTTNKLSNCFSGSSNFPTSCKHFFSNLNQCFFKCLKKVRIRSGCKKRLGDENIQEMLNLKAELKVFLRNNKCKIAQVIAENKMEEVEEYLDEKKLWKKKC